MARCENTGICSFYQDTARSKPMTRALMSMRDKYCKGDKQKCARYLLKKKIFQGYTLPDDHNLDEVGKILMDLRPDDHEHVRRIISLMVQ